MNLSRILISYILIILILFNSLRVSVTYAYYEIDPIGFIEALCENTDKPELACNGQCHLKKVSETHTDNNQTPTKLIDFKEVLLFIDINKDYEITSLINQEKHLFKYRNLYSHLETSILDHPPQV